MLMMLMASRKPRPAQEIHIIVSRQFVAQQRAVLTRLSKTSITFEFFELQLPST